LPVAAAGKKKKDVDFPEAPPHGQNQM
jgi:hypothetical protein